MAVTKEYAWQEADSLPGGKGAGFKTVQDWLDFMDLTGYFGYYGLPQEPGWTDPEITAKKETPKRVPKTLNCTNLILAICQVKVAAIKRANGFAIK